MSSGPRTSRVAITLQKSHHRQRPSLGYTNHVYCITRRASAAFSCGSRCTRMISRSNAHSGPLHVGFCGQSTSIVQVPGAWPCSHGVMICRMVLPPTVILFQPSLIM